LEAHFDFVGVGGGELDQRTLGMNFPPESKIKYNWTENVDDEIFGFQY